jgi:hypothetical protein
MTPSATRSNIDESHKATTLLVKRGIFRALLDLNLPTSRRQQCWQDLVLLQTSIFGLDRYGEEHWCLEESKLAEHWSRIEDVSRRLGHEITVQAGLSRIRTYQQIEVDTRFGFPVALKPIESFYRFKCCDVQLMRRVLADIPRNEGHGERNQDSLDILDAIEEVEDDLDDLQEDSVTFNGNRLLSVCRMFGINYALDEYTQYISNALDGYCTAEQIPIEAIHTDRDVRYRLKKTCGRLLKRLHDPTTIEILSLLTVLDPEPQSQAKIKSVKIQPLLR